MVVECFPPDVGGAGKRFYKIAERLSKRHTIDVFTFGKKYAHYKKRGFNVYSLNPNEPFSFSPLSKLSRVFYFGSSTFLQLLLHSYDLIDVDVWPFLPFFH